MEMKKCCFIIPYFGKLPSHFEVFLKTCEKNKDYDWIIFSDDEKEYKLPENVNLVKMDFNELKEIIQMKFDFKIVLDTPYKLCDYKPAYGYIFEELLGRYKFWGHCDLDIIVGDFNSFITNEMLNIYDKIFPLGHMILYKNTYENNRLFKNKIDNEYLYKKVFSTNDILVFDEICENKIGINDIFKNAGKKIYLEDLSFNIKILPTKFLKVTYNQLEKNLFSVENYKQALYIWHNGHIYRYYFDENNKIIREEFLYMHFQSRKMLFQNSILYMNNFKIIPNRFIRMKNNVKKMNKSILKKEIKNNISLHFFQVHWKWKKNKIEKMVKGNKK